MATGVSALFIYGLDLDASTTRRMEFDYTYLQVPRDRHLTIHGAVILRDRNQPFVNWQGGLPLAPRTRAIVDALRLLDGELALTVLHRGLQRGWITTQELDQAVRVLRRHRGLTQLRAMAAAAKKVGELVAERAKTAGVSAVVFGRGGYRYHGRVAASAKRA